MKKVFSLLLLMAFGVYTYAQQTPVDTAKAREIYLEKSKSQKTVAWILLGAGTVSTIGGIYVAFASTSDAGEIMFIAGLASIAGSIPLFIISHNNKQKALRLAIGPKIEENGQLIQMYAGRYQPAISFKLSLK
jgi:hypothetical protein